MAALAVREVVPSKRPLVVVTRRTVVGLVGFIVHCRKRRTDLTEKRSSRLDSMAVVAGQLLARSVLSVTEVDPISLRQDDRAFGPAAQMARVTRRQYGNAPTRSGMTLITDRVRGSSCRHRKRYATIDGRVAPGASDARMTGVIELDAEGFQLRKRLQFTRSRIGAGVTDRADGSARRCKLLRMA